MKPDHPVREVRLAQLNLARPIRILQVPGAMNPGGTETWLMHVLRHIDRNKFRLDFCTLTGQPGLFDPEIEELGSKVINCRLGCNPLSFARRFRRLLRQGSYDVVHSHVHLFSGAILRWAEAEGVPLRIAHSHTTSDGKPTSLRRRVYRRHMKSWIRRYATHGLAASQETAVVLFGEGWQEDWRFRVLHCGIDLRPFAAPVDRSAARRELGLPADALVVGHVGSFRPAKNHRFLLRIAAALLRVCPDVHFLLVGDGPLRPQIEAQTRQLGLSERVHFAGIRQDVPYLMRACMDVFLFPSLWEGLALVIVEAQAAGLPIVSADAVTRDIELVPGLIEFLPLSCAPEQWAQKLLVFLVQPKPDHTQALRCVVESPFSIECSVRNLADVYESTC